MSVVAIFVNVVMDSSADVSMSVVDSIFVVISVYPVVTSCVVWDSARSVDTSLYEDESIAIVVSDVSEISVITYSAKNVLVSFSIPHISKQANKCFPVLPIGHQ
jgi:hypothetical protein